MKIVIVYLLIVNLIGLILFGIDKKRAIDHAWRFPEKTLFTVALIGGSLGSILGMRLFRHKTKHWYFVIGMPMIFIVQAGVVVFLKIRGLI